MDKNEEGVGVIVTKHGHFQMKVKTFRDHMIEVQKVISECNYKMSEWTPLKKLGLCQEYYK